MKKKKNFQTKLKNVINKINKQKNFNAVYANNQHLSLKFAQSASQKYVVKIATNNGKLKIIKLIFAHCVKVKVKNFIQ